MLIMMFVLFDRLVSSLLSRQIRLGLDLSLTGLLAQEDQFELLERVGVGAYGLRHNV
jgi:hypothetical protein